uniref:Thrombospondin-like N-terminal domain-containing protein n=1 Tax=Hucho hucho TaxID=62062 RepID=A0A4W5PJV7_9TELE
MIVSMIIEYYLCKGGEGSSSSTRASGAPADLEMVVSSEADSEQEPSAESGVTLLQLIGDLPPDESRAGPGGKPTYYFGGLDGLTAAGQPALAHLPNPFYRDFSLVFQIIPSSPGVLFSITDASQKFMYVGVKLSAPDADGRNQKVLFYYTEPDSEASYLAASFTVPSLDLVSWTKFSLSVFNDQVTFFMGCDASGKTVKLERSPDDMELDRGAGIFVGQAGGADPDRFEGAIAELKVVGNPRAAELLCEDDDDSDAVSD